MLANEVQRRVDDGCFVDTVDPVWRRALADADNMRKRAARDGAQLRAQERAAVSLAWLPVLDNLELALAHAPSAGDPLVDGIAAIRSQAIDTLARLGYPRIDSENVPFDPRTHEVVSVSETDETDRARPAAAFGAGAELCGNPAGTGLAGAGGHAGTAFG